MNVFLFDASICNGCHGCQIACKDEHCDQPWGEYAAAQPMTGQFWCKCDEVERGSVPFVHVDYTVKMCGHCDDCKLIDACTDNAVYRREDGLVIIDPVKARGQEQLKDLCPNVYWNDELDLPQKCTGCAHLLDDGWDVPRCVDWCPTGALKFVSEFSSELKDAVPAAPGSHLYYKNMPKRRICGTVADRTVNEVIIGATVTFTNCSTGEQSQILTDEFGDFQWKQADEAEYDISIEAEGYLPLSYHVSTVDDDAVIPAIFVTAAPTAPRPPKRN